MISELRMESGMETAMMIVERQAAEEDKDHRAGKAGGDDGLADDAVDGSADEDGLIVQEERRAGWG